MPEPNRTSHQINLRVPPAVLADLDAWIAEINAGRRVNLVTRTSVVLSLLAWGLAERPPWAGGEPPGPAAPAPPAEPAKGRRR